MGGARQCRAVGKICVSPTHGTVPAPLEAAWETIRAGPSPRLRRPHLRRLAEAGRARARSTAKPASLKSSCPASSWPTGCKAISATGWRWPGARCCRSCATFASSPPPTGRKPSPLLILEEIPAAPASARERDPSAPNFDPRYRFETFVVGKANEVAATAARTLATADNVAFNPLFIHGGTGSRQDPPAARHRPGLPRTPPGRPGRVDVGRKVHGRVHPRAEGK